MNFLWETTGIETTFLPGKSKHFQAAHTKKYLVRFLEESGVKYLERTSRTLLKTISIKKAKDSYKDYGNKNDILFHSNFIESDEEQIVKSLYDNFGKSGNLLSKINAYTSPIIAASFNVSFDRLISYSESPEADIQTIGRCNRFGNNDLCELFFVHSNDRSSKSAVECRYDLKLNELWYQQFKKNFDGVEFILNDLYEFYNKFNTTNQKVLDEYLKNLEMSSLEKFTVHNDIGYYDPIKIPNSVSVKHDTNGKSLRSSSPQYNIIVRSGDTWISESFTVLRREFSGDGDKALLNISDNQYNKNAWIDILKQLKNVDGLNYSAFEKMVKHGKRKKDFSNHFLEIQSKNPQTPYPISTWTYDKKLGLEKND
jgi:CRISPR/Cas system-associated endonuclease/helicase Cas3